MYCSKAFTTAADRVLSVLLAIVLVVSFTPSAYAVEADAQPGSSQAVQDTVTDEVTAEFGDDAGDVSEIAEAGVAMISSDAERVIPSGEGESGDNATEVEESVKSQSDEVADFVNDNALKEDVIEELDMLQAQSELSAQSVNASATSKINQLKTQQYFKPGGACPSGKNVGWLVNGSTNCKAECYAFAAGVCDKLFGCHPGGVMSTGYTCTNPGNFNCVGSRKNPSLDTVKSLMQKGYPGDFLQFCSGGAWGGAQHSAILEAVDSNGVRIYQHGDSSHVSSTYYSWKDFYNSYLAMGSKNYRGYSGVSLYHYKDYGKRFPDSTPSTPSNVKLSQTTIKTGSSSVLSWNASSNATSYIIDGWCDGKEIMWKNVGNTTRYTLSGLGEGKYSFFVIAKNGDAASKSSQGVTLEVTNLVPSTARLSRSSIAPGGTSTLSWTKVSGATRYIVDGWHDGKEIMWKDVTSLSSLNLSYDEPGIYTFFVIATDGKNAKTTSKRVDLSVVSPSASSGTGSGAASGGSSSGTSGGGGTAASSPGTQPAAPVKASIAGAKVANVWNMAYTGKAQAQKPTVTLGGKALVLNRDYKLTYRNNVKVGTATMTVTGIGAYSGTKSATFKVTVAANSLAKAKVTGAKKRTYNGTAQTQSPKVKLGKSTLRAGRDYTITYSRNVNAGTATATVRGIGAYSGTKTFTFKIAPAKLSKAKVGVAAQRYTGRPVTPSPVVKVGGKVLRKGVDYTVTYKNNVKKGTAKLVIAGKGNYTGKKTVKFKIS